jgi:prepilin-type N-terminal cleavage/methylation domain-containing protein
MRVKAARAAAVAAFTLVEMLLVLLVISVMAGAAVVNLRGRQDGHALRAAAKDLAAAMQFAAARAEAEDCPYRVALDDKLQSFQVECLRPGSAGFVGAEGMAGAKKAMARGVTVDAIAPASPDASPPEDKTAALYFLPDGGGFAGSVKLKNRAAEVVHIDVLPGTRQIHVRG